MVMDEHFGARVFFLHRNTEHQQAMIKTLLLFVLFSFLASVLAESEGAGGIRCWAYQDGNGVEPHQITCPGADSVCVSYVAVDNDNLVTSTCVTQESCDVMIANPQVYGKVRCCTTDICNHPNSSENLTVHFVALLALVGLLLL